MPARSAAVFHGLRAVAALKRVQAHLFQTAVVGSPRPSCRGRIEAPSLEDDNTRAAHKVLHGLRAVAALKLVQVRQGRSPRRGSPRPSCRGRIEAKRGGETAAPDLAVLHGL